MTTTAKTAKQLADERKPDTFDYNGATFTVPDRALLGDDGRVPIDLIPAFVNCAIEAMNPNS